MPLPSEGVKIMFNSYWRIFRVVFVIFFLYLMGDIFYRWDAFKHYASFKDFIPSAGLVSLFWVIIAAAVSFIFYLISLTYHAFTGGFSDKEGGGQFTNAVQEKISPLVMMFGIWIALSVIIVSYQTWGKDVVSSSSQAESANAVAAENAPNILYVSFDALRSRSMSVYGYDRQTTPFMSEWAKTSAVFTRHQAESLNTFQTTPCMMTGKRVWSHQIYHEMGLNKFENYDESLPAVLKKNGYYTMLLSSNQIANAFKLGIDSSIDVEIPHSEFTESTLWLGRNYAKLNSALNKIFNNKIVFHQWIVQQDFILGKMLIAFGLYSDFYTQPYPPEKSFDKFLEIVEDRPDKPFFAWIHLNPPHYPYLAPEPYIGMYDPSNKYRSFKTQQVAKRIKSEESIRGLRDRYDELIRYSDETFKDFMSKLEERGYLENTVVIVSADHGESFERGQANHGGSYLNEESTRIPLIISDPRIKQGRVIDDLVEQVDIPATILGLCDIAVPEWMEGRSLVPLMRGENLPEIPIYSMNLQTNRALGHAITKGSIAVWQGDYKLVHILDNDETVLFNLKNDPDELDNLFEKEPEVGNELLAILKDDLEEANNKIVNGKN